MKILELLTEKRRVGNLGEDAAAKFLKKKRYKILERNYVALGHEIDIIAECRDAVVFVEVKTRTRGKEDPREPRPASAVTPKKQQSIIRAAAFYFGYYHPKGKTARFDVIEVYISEENGKRKVDKIVHLENTFNKDTAYRE